MPCFQTTTGDCICDRVPITWKLEGSCWRDSLGRSPIYGRNYSLRRRTGARVGTNNAACEFADGVARTEALPDAFPANVLVHATAVGSCVDFVLCVHHDSGSVADDSNLEARRFGAPRGALLGSATGH